MVRYNTGNPIDSNAMKDLSDNAKNMDLAANSPADTFQDRLGKSRLTWAGIVKAGSGNPAIAVDAAARAESAATGVEQNAEQIAQDAAQQAVDNVVIAVDGAVGRAEGSADRAETARDAAFVNADVYPDIASGLAAVADGEQFQVVEGDEIVRYRRDSASAQTSVARYPSADAVSALSADRVDTVPGKNLFNAETRELSKFIRVSDKSIIDSSGYDTSEYIDVTVGQVYALTKVRSLAQFDASGAIVSAVDTPATFTPSQPRIRVTVFKSDIGGAQVEEGSAATEYAPYMRVVPSSRIKLLPRSISRDAATDDLIGMYPFHKRATVPTMAGNGAALFKAIKDIRIFGDILDGEDFYVDRYFYKYEGTTEAAWSLVTVASTLRGQVAESYFRESEGYVYPAHATTVLLSEKNSSGITALLTIDWNELPENSSAGFSIAGYAGTGLAQECKALGAYTNRLDEDVDILLPDTIYGVTGVETNIYFENVIKCTDLDRYQILIWCPVGTVDDGRWTVKPTEPGTYSLRITVFRDASVIVKYAEFQFVVTSRSSAGGSRTAIFIGDSLTEQGFYTQHLQDNFAATEDPMSLSLIGTRGVAGNRAEGRGGWKAAFYVEKPDHAGVTNPFWNPTAGAFDFAYYMGANEFQTPDYVCVMLGTNDFNGYTDISGMPAFAEITAAHLQTIVGSVKSYDPSIKVCVMLPPPCASDQHGLMLLNRSNYNYVWANRRGIFLLNQHLLKAFEGRQAEGIHVVPTNMNLDTENGFATAEVAASDRITALVKVQVENYHPTSEGYWQMADTVYGFLKAQA